MKTIILVAMAFGSSLSFAFGICGADCQFAKLLNIRNGSAGGAYSRILTSVDLREGNEYTSLIDLKTCTAREILKEDNEEGNELSIKTWEGTGIEAFKYFSSWENMKRLNLTPEHYNALKAEFPKNRKFCFGNYSTADAWTSEYSNFVYSMDGEFFFAEVYGLGI